MSTDAQRAGELQRQLSDASPLLGRRRRRRAAQDLAGLARSGTPEAVAALTQALASSADAKVREIASSALRSLPEGPAREALCRLAVEEGDAAALTIAMESRYVPAEPPARAALLALSGRWTELEVFDLESLHLTAAYEAASPGLRKRLAAAAREAGRAEWVQVALGGRGQRRLAEMTRAEWQDVAALLAAPEGAAEAWRLATAAPPFWARTLLLGIGEPGALPEGEREDFARLRALAALCDEEATRLSAAASCVAALEGHEDGVGSVAVTPDGSLLASASDDRTIRLWRLPDGEHVATLRGHEDDVLSLAVTPDGSLLASGSEDRTVRLWRLPGGEHVATLPEHEHGVSSLAVTPNGRLLACGSWDKTIRLWRLPGGKHVATLRGHRDRVRALAIAPDSSLLASGEGDGTVHLWSLPGGEHVATLPGHEFAVCALAVTPDGSLLASGSRDHTTRLWSLPGGEHVATLRGHEGSVESLAVTPDGGLLASGSNDRTIRLWGSEIPTLAATRAAALARDHDRLLTLRSDAGVGERERVWLDFMLALGRHGRRRAAEELAELARSGTPAALAALTQALASSADEEVREIASSALRSLPEGPAQEALCRLAVEEGDAVALTIATESRSAPSEPPRRAALLALSGRWAELEAFDMDGVNLGIAYEAASSGLRRRLAAAAREAGRGEWVQVALGGRGQRRLAEMTREEWQDVAALLAAPERAAEAWRLAAAAPPFWARTLLLGIDDPGALPEGERADFARLRALAALCGDGEIPLSAPVSCATTLRGHEDLVHSLAVTPDGGLLASGSWDKTIRLWRLPGAECAGVVQEHDSALTSLAITPDGSLLASGGWETTIHLWRLPGGEHATTLPGHASWVKHLAVTPDGSLLASASGERTISLWSLPDGRCVATLRGHKSLVRSLAVTPDGSLLASASWDHTVRLWSLPGGESVATLEGHTDGILALAVSPDGRLLASGGWDQTIRLWRLPEGEHVATLRGHRRAVYALAVTPDGSLLASGDADGTIRLWRSDIAALAAAPVRALARDHHRLLTLRRDARVDGSERAWLDLMLALVERHLRYDVEIAAATHVTVGESDIEIGE